MDAYDGLDPTRGEATKVSDTFGQIDERGIRTLRRSSSRHLSACRDQQGTERSSSGKRGAPTRGDARETNACVEEGIWSGEALAVVNGSGDGVVDNDEWLCWCWATGGGTGTGAGLGGAFREVSRLLRRWFGRWCGCLGRGCGYGY